MRKVPLLILLAITVALGAMIFLHRQSTHEHEQLQSRIEILQSRENSLRDMSISLEKYRRMSSHFHKMSQPDIDRAKDELRHSINQGIAQMEKLRPNGDETIAMDRIQHGLDSMMQFAAQYERMYYSKDAYQKPEMVAFHQGVVKAVSQIEQSTESRIGQLQKKSSAAQDTATPVMIMLAVAILLLFIANSGREYWTYERPLQRMHAYSIGLRDGSIELSRMRPLKGRFGDIQSSFVSLVQMVQGHARERHKFILDVVSDLRSPLIMLQEGKHLLGSSGESIDPAEELRALDSVKRGLAMLSGSLEDMDDIVEYSRLDSKLQEDLIDLSELVNSVARTLNAGPGLEKQITTTVPPMPIWTRIDARRFERVMIQTITKVASTLHQGTGIHITVEQPTQGAFRGVEILIQDLERARDQGGRVVGSGPDVDILKHWIAEKGLGMTLAHRVIKAEGGMITASGVPGTSVQISIRLPQERLAQVGLISAPRGLEVNLGRMLGNEETAGESGEVVQS